MNRLDQTESAVFLLCRVTVFLKDPLFRLFTNLIITVNDTKGRIRNTSMHRSSIKARFSDSMGMIVQLQKKCIIRMLCLEIE